MVSLLSHKIIDLIYQSSTTEAEKKVSEKKHNSINLAKEKEEGKHTTQTKRKERNVVKLIFFRSFSNRWSQKTLPIRSLSVIKELMLTRYKLNKIEDMIMSSPKDKKID